MVACIGPNEGHNAAKHTGQQETTGCIPHLSPPAKLSQEPSHFLMGVYG